MDRTLTVDDVARLLGISKTTVREWVSKGALPPPRAFGPKLVRWLESEIDDWMRSRPAARQMPERRAMTADALGTRRQTWAGR